MSVALAAVARAAREARPRPEVTCVHVPQRPLADPALSQVTAEMPAVAVAVAPAPRVVAPEVEPMVFAPRRAVPEPLDPEPAVFVTQPAPSPRFERPARRPRESSPPDHLDRRWGWTEPWGFEILAPAQLAGPRRARRRRSGRPRGGAHPMIPLAIIALALAACVWVELPRGPAAAAAPRAARHPYVVTVTYSPHPSDFAVQTIPTAYLHLYWRTADRYGLDWTKLAAVGQVESDQGRSQAAGVAEGTNRAGAAGPAQFVRTTWAAYGVDADGRGSINPYDPADAIATMARYLKASGAPLNWHAALFAYNHSHAYVDDVLTLSRRYLAR